MTRFDHVVSGLAVGLHPSLDWPLAESSAPQGVVGEADR